VTVPIYCLSSVKEDDMAAAC